MQSYKKFLLYLKVQTNISYFEEQKNQSKYLKPMFTPNDIAQIEARGLSLAEVERQIENFRTGFPALPVVRAASIGDGIKRLDEEELKAAEALYEGARAELKTIKFVPASGAATRMFKELFEYVNDD